MTSVKEINVKNRTYYFFDDMFNIKNLDPNEIKVDGKSYKNIIWVLNGYIEESNENKYLTLVRFDKSKNTLKKIQAYGVKSEILLDQQAISKMNMIRNI